MLYPSCLLILPLPGLVPSPALGVPLVIAPLQLDPQSALAPHQPRQPQHSPRGQYSLQSVVGPPLLRELMGALLNLGHHQTKGRLECPCLLEILREVGDQAPLAPRPPLSGCQNQRLPRLRLSPPLPVYPPLTLRLVLLLMPLPALALGRLLAALVPAPVLMLGPPLPGLTLGLFLMAVAPPLPALCPPLWKRLLWGLGKLLAGVPLQLLRRGRILKLLREEEWMLGGLALGLLALGTRGQGPWARVSAGKEQPRGWEWGWAREWGWGCARACRIGR